MSLPWKSELRVRLGRDGCSAQRLARWSRRVLDEQHAGGPPEESIARVLRALRHTAPLPPTTRLLIADEQAYLSLRPAPRRWHEARAEAARHFATTLGRQDLLVQVAEFGHGAAWLAAAVEAADVERWRAALASEGMRLEAVGLALLADLAELAPHVDADATVALLRREGVSLVRLRGGVPVEFTWERCDPDSRRCIEQRVLAFQSLFGQPPDPVWLLCPMQSHLQSWTQIARGHRWKVLARPSSPPRGGALATA